MAMTEVDMAEYVKREELAGYVLRTEIEAEMTNVAGKKVIAAMGSKDTKEEVERLTQAIVKQKVDEEWSAEESKALIVQIAQSATKDMIQHEVEKIYAQIELLRSERQPSQEEDAKEKGKSDGDEKGKIEGDEKGKSEGDEKGKSDDQNEIPN